ncbi:MAG: sigma-70 family RNA polymerase sigma factor [Lachnospiraceae bacterium]|nr:sigma-70 family RNA polymerase sigma factor [Lachnospiraceae bacterium]
MTSTELEMCITEYGADVFAFCKSLTLSQWEAEELFQDTFVKAAELRGKMDAGNNVKSYLLSIALRLWRNKRRKYAWRSRIAGMQSLEEGYDAGALEKQDETMEQMLMSEERRLVREAVERLPEKLRVVTLLYYMEELPVNEIAEVMKIPRGTVLSRLHKARELLREELKEVF